MNPQQFSEAERQGVYRAIAQRRDVRHFTPSPVAPEQLQRLLLAAHQDPSVGLMQPWRFIRIADDVLRTQLHAHVSEERLRTAQALGPRAAEFLRLKVEGMLSCGELLVVALMDQREAHVFGRRTMPHMDVASAACAIQNLWLAARAEGLGVGWVSLFEPAEVRALCRMPAGSEPLAILCVGHVDEFAAAPLLELTGWAQRCPLHELLYQDMWGRFPPS